MSTRSRFVNVNLWGVAGVAVQLYDRSFVLLSSAAADLFAGERSDDKNLFELLLISSCASNRTKGISGSRQISQLTLMGARVLYQWRK